MSVNAYEDEDIRLWKSYKGGNAKAKWDLLDRFKGVIQRHVGQNLNVLPKAVAEAKLKKYTIQAFDTYRPGAGAKLSTHVYNYLQKINRDNYNNQQTIRLPENLAIGYTRFMGAKKELEDTFGREPNMAELSDHLGWGLRQTAIANKKYHKEYVESKQTFDAGIEESDVSSSVIRFCYGAMSDDERFLFEHKTGYNGQKVYPMAKIQRDLKLTAYQFNQLQIKLTKRLREAAQVLGADL